eukprot:348887-Amphidinium_carterae.2
MCQRVWRRYSQSLSGEGAPGKESHPSSGSGTPVRQGYRSGRGQSTQSRERQSSPCRARHTGRASSLGYRAPSDTASRRERRRTHGRLQWSASKFRPPAWRGGRRRAYWRQRSAQTHSRKLGCRRGALRALANAKQCGAGGGRDPGKVGSETSGRGQVYRSKCHGVLVSTSVWICFTLKHLTREHPEEMPGFTGTLQGGKLEEPVTRTHTHCKRTKTSLLGFTGNSSGDRSTDPHPDKLAGNRLGKKGWEKSDLFVFRACPCSDQDLLSCAQDLSTATLLQAGPVRNLAVRDRSQEWQQTCKKQNSIGGRVSELESTSLCAKPEPLGCSSLEGV